MVSFLYAHKQHYDCNDKAIQISTAEYYTQNLYVDSLILKVIQEIVFIDSSLTCIASSITNF